MLQVDLDPFEMDELRKMAREARLSVVAYVRLLLMQHIQNPSIIQLPKGSS
jgi:hypothetical protein